MRRWSGLPLIVLAIGCLAPPTAPLGVMDRLRAVGGPVGPDVVVLDVAVVEQPPADPFIDQDLWSAADEQAIALDRKAALDDNGFRVAVVGGLIPGKLTALLATERSTPEEPHRITMRSGNTKHLTVGPTKPEATYSLRIDGETRPVKLTAAQFGFAVVPARTPDGRIRLTFTPQAAHGGRSFFVQPAEGDGWSIAGSRPVEKYTDLSFEITITPHEYVLIGSKYDCKDTFGHTFFIGPSGDRLVQRLLVIRGRPQGEPPVDFDWATGARPVSGTPLAYRAARTARGVRE